MYADEFRGVVLFSKEFKEHDAMVKLFTREYGKQMFFVKHMHKGQHPLKMALQPFTIGQFVGKINRDGLSFIREYRDRRLFKKAYEDISVQAYMTYMVNLVDAVIDDRMVNEALYDVLEQAIVAISKDVPIRLAVLLFELKLLHFFGVTLALDHCQMTKASVGPFDYSFQYGGLLSQSQWDKDVHRLHANPNAIYVYQQLQHLSFDRLGTVTLSDSVLSDMRYIMDCWYDEYVGIKLKSKKFIQEMETWHV